MIKTWLRWGGVAALAAAALGMGAASNAETVLSINPTPGDAVTGVGDAFVPIDSTNWYYANLRAGATVGINTRFADQHGGNGSVLFETLDGVAKADVAYFTGGSLGLLNQLTKLTYEWYRDSSSTVAQHLAPVVRIEVSNGTQTGSLIWEDVYNGGSTSVPVDTNKWVTSTALTSTSEFWASPALWGPTGPDTYKTLSDWITALGANTQVIGFSMGVGSGWTGTFTGAVDYLTYGFNNDDPTVVDFEVRPIPEPGSIVMGLIAGGLGLAGAAWRRRRGS